MSALWAPTSDQAAREHEVERPFLRGLPRPAPRLARVPFLLVLIALFAVGMTGLLMLNTTLQNQAFQVSTLNRQASELAYTQADLESRIDRLSAPQELARRASAAGLRPNPYPAFLVLPKGKVVGKPQPVTGAEAPTLVIKTPAELAADKAAAAAERKAAAIRRKAEAAAAAAEAKAAKKAAKEKMAAPKQAGPKKPVANKPAAKKPPADKPAAKKPAAKKPAAKKPAAKKPARSGGG